MAELESSTSFVPASAIFLNVSKPNPWTSGQKDELPDHEKHGPKSLRFHLYDWRCHRAETLRNGKPDGDVKQIEPRQHVRIG